MTTTDRREPLRFEDELLEPLLDSLRERHGFASTLPNPRAPRRRWTTAFAVAGASLMIAVAVPTLLPGGEPGGAEPAAAAMLHQLALLAAQQPPEPAPGPGQYLYTRSESSPRMLYVVGDGNTFFFTQPLIRESWLGGPDGSGRIFNTAGSVTFPTEEDRAAWIAAGSPHLPDLYGDLDEGNDEFDEFSPGELTYSNYAELPTDPQELLELIESRELGSGPDGDWQTFSIIGDLLRESYTVPKVRAALYEVAAELPGVELVGPVVDSAGRSGVAVAYTRVPGRGLELIFDPATAALLGESYVNVEDNDVDVESGGAGAIYGAVGPSGTRTFTITWLVWGVVNSTHESL